MQENKSNLVIYNDGELELKISLNNEIKRTGTIFQMFLCFNFQKKSLQIGGHNL